jgi:putative transposase
LAQRVKGKTSRKLLSEYRHLAKKFWGRHLWARGYFASSSGNVTDEVIMQYIEAQDMVERARDDDFTIGP